MTNEIVNEMIKEAHSCAVDMGFYDNPPSVKTLLALIISELCESIEADRKGKKASKIPDHEDNSFSLIYSKLIKDTVEDELAGAMIRIFDLAGFTDSYLFTNKATIFENNFPEMIFDIIKDITRISPEIKDKIAFEMGIGFIASNILAIAKKQNIDLWPFIKAKMRYNRLRGHMHGKKY